MIGVRFSCNIGSKYYNLTSGFWDGTASTENWIFTSKKDGVQLGNQWVPMGANGSGILLKLGMPDLGIVFNGDFNFQIWSDTYIQVGSSIISFNNSLLREVWIKNLSIALVNFNGSEISDNDIEYVGELDPLYSKEGESISLTCGTGGQFSDRGKIMFNDGADYYEILSWTRNTQSYKIEELLLSSICSNYDANFVTFNSMNLRNDLSIINVLTDTYIAGKIMMVNGVTINYADNVFSCSLIEISPDALTIVK